MRIDSIELYLVENRFYRPWRTAYGSDAGNCVLITRMRSGDHEGWSETSALSGPNYSYESVSYTHLNHADGGCGLGKAEAAVRSFGGRRGLGRSDVDGLIGRCV